MGDSYLGPGWTFGDGFQTLLAPWTRLPTRGSSQIRLRTEGFSGHQNGPPAEGEPAIRTIRDSIQTPASRHLFGTSMASTPPPQVMVGEAQRGQSSVDCLLLSLQT